MVEIKKNISDINFLLLSTLSRLKGLVSDQVPKIVWETKFNIPEKIPNDKILRFEPE